MKYKEKGIEWYSQFTAEDFKLNEKVESFGDLFADFLFQRGSITGKMNAIKSQISENGKWIDDEARLPDELEYFTYEWFGIKVLPLDNDFMGQFNKEDLSLTIAPEFANQDPVILHEMIHLHEHVLNELPMFYHDAVFWCLYCDLKKKIPDLDDRIERHGHMLNEQSLYEQGGLHDILFFLKSLDLDLKKGYPLGTVFGYGMEEEQ